MRLFRALQAELRGKLSDLAVGDVVEAFLDGGFWGVEVLGVARGPAEAEGAGAEGPAAEGTTATTRVTVRVGDDQVVRVVAAEWLAWFACDVQRCSVCTCVLLDVLYVPYILLCCWYCWDLDPLCEPPDMSHVISHM